MSEMVHNAGRRVPFDEMVQSLKKKEVSALNVSASVKIIYVFSITKSFTRLNHLSFATVVRLPGEETGVRVFTARIEDSFLLHNSFVTELSL